jgi:predicted SAM-dependent methyltransferase
MGDVRIDLGCGNAKQDGYIGLDYVEGPQVDHVLDLTRDQYPFDDHSVDAVFSAHFLEHIEEPNHVFSEIGRICRDGARIEFWTPYAFTNEAFLYGHLHFLTEEPWMHFCVSHRDVFLGMLGGRWQLHRIVYVIQPHVVAEMQQAHFTLDFAVRYLKGVVHEFGVEIEYVEDPATPVVVPERVYATSRDGQRQPLVTGATA